MDLDQIFMDPDTIIIDLDPIMRIVDFKSRFGAEGIMRIRIRTESGSGSATLAATVQTTHFRAQLIWMDQNTHPSDESYFF